jgi:hypothetical protein
MSIDPALLLGALRGAAALAEADGDPGLRELAGPLHHLAARLAADLEALTAHAAAQAAAEATLSERLLYLRLLLQADASLRHTNPTRAATAAALLRALPGLCEEETVAPHEARTAQKTLLLIAQAVLEQAAAPDVHDALARLGLAHVVLELAEACAQAERLCNGAPAVPDALIAEALELCADYRAYVVVATGKLDPRGERPARRQQLLQPVMDVLLV